MLYKIKYKSVDNGELCDKEITNPKLSAIPKMVNILLSMGISPVEIAKGSDMTTAEFQREMSNIKLLYIETEYEVGKQFEMKNRLSLPGGKSREITIIESENSIRFFNGSTVGSSTNSAETSVKEI